MWICLQVHPGGGFGCRGLMLKVDVKDGNIDAELQTDEEHLWIYF